MTTGTDADTDTSRLIRSSIRDFEDRVAALMVAYSPGCAAFGESALAGLSEAQAAIVGREALHRIRASRIRRETAAGTRNQGDDFLNSMAEALLLLPADDRERRVARCPKVLQIHVRPMIAAYQADRDAFYARVGIPACTDIS
jgi:hypothetical protein